MAMWTQITFDRHREHIFLIAFAGPAVCRVGGSLPGKKDMMDLIKMFLRQKYHGDAGWTVGGTGAGGGWLSGTRRVDPVSQVDTPGGPPAPWGADCWNIATVRYGSRSHDVRRKQNKFERYGTGRDVLKRFGLAARSVQRGESGQSGAFRPVPVGSYGTISAS
jgi:hypothetical protein